MARDITAAGGAVMVETTEFLYMIKPTRKDMLATGPTSAEDRVIAEHFAYLKDLADQGMVVLAGRSLTTDEHSFGIVIFRAPSRDQARDIMARDPAVAEGVMRAELFPYRIALLGTNRQNGREES
jgi:uncharacterized protein YciI